MEIPGNATLEVNVELLSIKNSPVNFKRRGQEKEAQEVQEPRELSEAEKLFAGVKGKTA